MNRDSLLNYKPVFQKFIEANLELIDCYGRIPKSELESMSQSAKDGRCNTEKAKIRSILDSNELTMTNMVKDRVNVMYKLNEMGQMRTIFVETDDDIDNKPRQ